jgi:hypothetical protein
MRRILSQDEMAEKAKERSLDYEQLSPEQQWGEDKELGILDWEGSQGPYKYNKSDS